MVSFGQTIILFEKFYDRQDTREIRSTRTTIKNNAIDSYSFFKSNKTFRKGGKSTRTLGGPDEQNPSITLAIYTKGRLIKR